MSILICILRMSIANHSRDRVTQGSVRIDADEEGAASELGRNPAFQFVYFLPSGASKLWIDETMRSMDRGTAERER